MAAALRLVLVVWGLALGSWAVWSLLTSRDEAQLGAVAARIAMGDTFAPEILASLDAPLARVEAAPLPKPAVLRSAAIIRLRRAELELGSARALTGNPAFAQAEATLRAALAVAPTDAFLWFGLCWLGKTRDGFRDAQVPLLRMSYDTGGNEGWVAAHRNALAVTILSRLPADLQARVVAEFRALVASGYADVAAEILAGPGWMQRERLLAGLDDVPEERRRRVSHALVARGVDVDVPGIERPATRPWQ